MALGVLRARVARVLAGVAAFLATAAGSAGLARPAADVGIAVDAAAPAAAASVALAIDRRAVRAATAARSASPLAAPPAGTALALAGALATAALLGDQVLGDLGLVEVLVVENRPELVGSRCRCPELRVPDRAERRRARAARRGGDLGLLFLVVLEGFGVGRRRLSSLDGLACGQQLAVAPASAAAAATATPAPPPPTGLALAVLLGVAIGGRAGHRLRVDVEGRQLLVFGVCGRTRRSGRRGRGDPGQLLAGKNRHRAVAGGRRSGEGLGARGHPGSARSSTGTGAGGDRLGLARPATATAATAAALAGALGLLVGDLGHRQVLVVAGDPPARARRGLVDACELRDVGEQVRDLDQVAGGVAAEAHDLDPDAHLLDGPDRGGEVAVTRDHDRDVEVAGGLHQVDDELDVEVRLDLAVAVLADVLADDLVVVPRQEGVEVALVLVVGVEPRVCVRADEIAPGGGRLEQRDVVDVRAGRLGRVEDVRHVHEDGDVLAHLDSSKCRDRGPSARSRCLTASGVQFLLRTPAAPTVATRHSARGPAGTKP